MATFNYRSDCSAVIWYEKLRGIGGDLGSAVKGFKEAMGDDKDKPATKDADFDAKSLNQNNVDSSVETAETKKTKSRANRCLISVFGSWY